MQVHQRACNSRGGRKPRVLLIKPSLISSLFSEGPLKVLAWSEELQSDKLTKMMALWLSMILINSNRLSKNFRKSSNLTHPSDR